MNIFTERLVFVRLVLVMAGLSLATPSFCAQPTPLPESDAKTVAAYRTAWGKGKAAIPLDEIESWVADLRSENERRRSSALNRFREETRLDFPFGFLKDPTGIRDWQKYAANLETAIRDKIPLLLQAPTRENRSSRKKAAMYLGKDAPHTAFLPLLGAIVANEADSPSVRYWALTSISQIPHEGVIEFLIACLDQQPNALPLRAWEKLLYLTGSGIYNDTGDWRDVKRRYETWWAENKENFKYRRGRVLGER